MSQIATVRAGRSPVVTLSFMAVVTCGALFLLLPSVKREMEKSAPAVENAQAQQVDQVVPINTQTITPTATPEPPKYAETADALQITVIAQAATDDYNLKVERFRLDNEGTAQAATAQAQATQQAVEMAHAELVQHNEAAAETARQAAQSKRNWDYFLMSLVGLSCAAGMGTLFGLVIWLVRKYEQVASEIETDEYEQDDALETDEAGVFPVLIGTGEVARVNWHDYGNDAQTVASIARLVSRDCMFRTAHYQVHKSSFSYDDYVTFRTQFSLNRWVDANGKQYFLTSAGRAVASALAKLKG